MKHKKAQIDQVFIYIVAIFLAAMILIFGYKAITKFVGETDKIALVDFQTEIEKEIKEISSSFESRKTVEFNVPSAYNSVCLVDDEYLNKGETCLCKKELCNANNIQDYNRYACNAWEAGTQNVFLIPQADIELNVVKMQIDAPGYLCVKPINGKIMLMLEGRGAKTKISKVD